MFEDHFGNTNVKLIDFGLAKKLPANVPVQHTSKLKGTSRYLAPE